MPTERIAVRDIYIYFLCKPFYTLLFSNAKKNDVSVIICDADCFEK